MRIRSILALVVLAALAVPVLAGAQVGAEVYNKCLACHKRDGRGTPGVFPPLAGTAAEIAKAPGGRAVLIEVVLYGMQGEFHVAGKTYKGTMREFSQLTDGEIAAVLNHVLGSWGNDKLLPKDFSPIEASEVKALRGKALTGTDVLEKLKKVGLK